MNSEALASFVREETLNLEQLVESLESFNPFDVLGVVHRELQHSNFLAWLLDPRANHKAGNYFLKALIGTLGNITSKNRIEWMLASLEHVQVRREWKNIDLLIISANPKFVICIENKVWAGKSGQNQLVKYADLVNEQFEQYERVFVYLTPYARALEPEEEEKGYENLTYQFVEQTVEDLLMEFQLREHVRTFLASYLSNIRKHILMTDESITLAQQIYQRHKAAIDFIVSNKPVVWSEELFQAIKDYIKRDEELVLLTEQDKGIIRFLPDAVHSVFKYPVDAWSDPNLLFAIEILINDSSIWFKFCFGAINVEESKVEKYQGIKTDFYNTMKEFKSLKPYLISSGSQYNYPSVAYYTLFSISETEAVSPAEFFAFFKDKFAVFNTTVLKPWRKEVQDHLQVKNG